MIAGAAAILTPDFPARRAQVDVHDALRQIPGGVGLVTWGSGPAFFAMTAVSIAPFSVESPTLILCLANGGQAAGDDISVAGLRRAPQ